jgi:hypothetical protein
MVVATGGKERQLVCFSQSDSLCPCYEPFFEFFFFYEYYLRMQTMWELALDQDAQGPLVSNYSIRMGHTSAIGTIAWQPQRNLLLSGGADG